MKRISTPTAVDSRFVDGDGLSRKATQFSAEWCNQVQEELCNAIKSITGQDVTGLSDHELADALNGNRVFLSVTIGGNGGGMLRIVTGVGPVISNFASISAGVVEATTAVVDKLSEKTTDGNIQVLNKLVGDSGDDASKVLMGAVAADSLEVGGDASVSGDVSVTGDVSAEDMIAIGKVTADVGFETNNGDIKSTNGEVSGSTVKATGKLTLGSSLGFVIDGTSGHTASDAETWLANTAPQNSLLYVINDMTSGVTLWSDSRQTAIIGKCALLVIKVGSSVYPVIANPNS